MKKINKSKTSFENENINNNRKTIYSKRKLPLGIISCVLSLTLFVSLTKVDQIFSLPTIAQGTNAVEETSVNTPE